MIFQKKKRMIDLRELQKRGVVKIPRRDIMIPTNAEGFVELTGKSSGLRAAETTINSSTTESKPEIHTNNDFFNFLDTPSEPAIETYGSSAENNFQTSIDGYNKREVDEKMVNLDNKIYKLEQRIELLERKAGVGEVQDSNGIIGW